MMRLEREPTRQAAWTFHYWSKNVRCWRSSESFNNALLA